MASKYWKHPELKTAVRNFRPNSDSANKRLLASVNNVHDDYLNSILHYAVAFDEAIATNYIVTSGHIQQPNYFLKLPLHIAAAQHNCMTFKSLLKSNNIHVLLSRKDLLGMTSIDWLDAVGCQSCIQNVKSLGVDVNSNGKVYAGDTKLKLSSAKHVKYLKTDSVLKIPQEPITVTSFPENSGPDHLSDEIGSSCTTTQLVTSRKRSMPTHQVDASDTVKPKQNDDDDSECDVFIGERPLSPVRPITSYRITTVGKEVLDLFINSQTTQPDSNLLLDPTPTRDCLVPTYLGSPKRVRTMVPDPASPVLTKQMLLSFISNDNPSCSEGLLDTSENDIF